MKLSADEASARVLWDANGVRLMYSSCMCWFPSFKQSWQKTFQSWSACGLLEKSAMLMPTWPLTICKFTEVLSLVKWTTCLPKSMAAPTSVNKVLLAKHGIWASRMQGAMTTQASPRAAGKRSLWLACSGCPWWLEQHSMVSALRNKHLTILCQPSQNLWHAVSKMRKPEAFLASASLTWFSHPTMDLATKTWCSSCCGVGSSSSSSSSSCMGYGKVAEPSKGSGANTAKWAH